MNSLTELAKFAEEVLGYRLTGIMESRMVDQEGNDVEPEQVQILYDEWKESMSNLQE